MRCIDGRGGRAGRLGGETVESGGGAEVVIGGGGFGDEGCEVADGKGEGGNEVDK